MNRLAPPLASGPETVAELRDLYRAAEARAARLRLLIAVERQLANATAATLDAVLARSARDIALFAGFRDGRVVLDAQDEGLPLHAPGPDARIVGMLQLDGGEQFDAVADREDREAIGMLAQLIGEAIDRVAREREREALLNALRERERRLEHVVGRLFSAQEEERRRVSRELHDGVAQIATALFRRLEASADHEAAAIARELVRELRGVIGGLRPTMLDDLGLKAALTALVEGLRQDGYAVALDSAGPDRWPPVLETAFFRIAQEAIANIRKHAGGPCRVAIALVGDEGAGRWELHVRDHGRGLADGAGDRRGDPDGAHVGIAMMRERMLAVGGELRIASGADGGVAITARIGSAAA